MDQKGEWRAPGGGGIGDSENINIPMGREMTVEEQQQFLAVLLAGFIKDDIRRIAKTD
ncbi:MAG: hypothetical protein WC445_03830 [Patescibacteria group bacterium]